MPDIDQKKKIQKHQGFEFAIDYTKLSAHWHSLDWVSWYFFKLKKNFICIYYPEWCLLRALIFFNCFSAEKWISISNSILGAPNYFLEEMFQYENKKCFSMLNMFKLNWEDSFTIEFHVSVRKRKKKYVSTPIAKALKLWKYRLICIFLLSNKYSLGS